MECASRDWENPIGDGEAARRIIDVVERVMRDGVILFDNSGMTRSEAWEM
jgi:hypothetical protein